MSDPPATIVHLAAADPGRLVASVGGVGIALWMAVVIRLSFVSLRWPSTSGKIISSEVADNSDRSDGDLSYYHSVRYEYTVGGRKYKGTRLHVGPQMHRQFRSWVEPDAQAYVAGSTTRVYYNPDRPEAAVLEPGPRVPHIVLLLIGLGSATYLAWPSIFG